MPKKTGRRGTRKAVKRKARKPVRKSAKKTTRKVAVKKKAAKPTKKAAPKPSVKMPPMVVKPSKPPMEPRPSGVPTVAEQRVGFVTHYYSHLSVAVIKLDQGSLQVGDSIHVKGHTTDFQQRVESMQVEHQPIQRADLGQECAVKVTEHVREHDVVYKVL